MKADTSKHLISIHALLAESDINRNIANGQSKKFLSTLSLRRATSQSSAKSTPEEAFLSTLSLRRATVKNASTSLDIFISIHALLAESDPGKNLINGIRLIFLSTLSLRRATLGARRRHTHNLTFLSTLSLRRATGQPFTHYIANNISIHALLAESDPLLCSALCCGSISIHALLAESDKGGRS